MVKIGIDARFYGTENTGLGRYTMSLLLPLTKLLKTHTLYVFLSDPYYRKLKFPKNVIKVHCNLPHYSFREQLILPLMIAQRKLDLWFSFHFNTPVFSPVHKITVIHDLIKTYSTGRDTTTRAPWLYQLKRLGYKLAMGRAVRDSLAIITPTNTVKNDILALYNERPEKIYPVWEAPTPSLQRPQQKSTNHNLALLDHYLLYVGNSYPHKNINILLKAMDSLPHHKLVLVSTVTPYLSRLFNQLSRDVRERLVILSQLKDQDLHYLYTHADALIAPSHMEGFGLPGLEALSLGTRVVASNIPVFREVYGKRVTYFDSSSSQDLAQAIQKTLRLSPPKPWKYPRTWQVVAQDIAKVVNESCASL